MCSLSILVTTAMVGDSSRKLPSLSSASATKISPCAHFGVGAEHVHPAADHHRRVQTRRAQHRRDHRRGRGFAVAAGHRDAVFHAHQLGRASRRAESPGYGVGALRALPDWHILPPWRSPPPTDCRRDFLPGGRQKPARRARADGASHRCHEDRSRSPRTPNSTTLRRCRSCRCRRYRRNEFYAFFAA